MGKHFILYVKHTPGSISKISNEFGSDSTMIVKNRVQMNVLLVV